MAKNKVKLITWMDRFCEAMAIFTLGIRPPEKLVTSYFDQDTDPTSPSLQDWVGVHCTTLKWAQNIVIIDACVVLANTPCEGEPCTIDYKDFYGNE